MMVVIAINIVGKRPLFNTLLGLIYKNTSMQEGGRCKIGGAFLRRRGR
jgi:hypothetical protein